MRKGWKKKGREGHRNTKCKEEGIDEAKKNVQNVGENRGKQDVYPETSSDTLACLCKKGEIEGKYFPEGLAGAFSSCWVGVKQSTLGQRKNKQYIDGVQY